MREEGTDRLAAEPDEASTERSDQSSIGEIGMERRTRGPPFQQGGSGVEPFFAIPIIATIDAIESFESR
jgi:hypothetical protein